MPLIGTEYKFMQKTLVNKAVTLHA